MNGKCYGDYYTLNGARFYRCFADGTVLDAADEPDRTCTHCGRPIEASEHGAVVSRAWQMVEVRLKGRWLDHSTERARAPVHPRENPAPAPG